jgi:hypothetical protein
MGFFPFSLDFSFKFLKHSIFENSNEKRIQKNIISRWGFSPREMKFKNVFSRWNSRPRIPTRNKKLRICLNVLPFSPIFLSQTLGTLWESFIYLHDAWGMQIPCDRSPLNSDSACSRSSTQLVRTSQLQRWSSFRLSIVGRRETSASQNVTWR